MLATPAVIFLILAALVALCVLFYLVIRVKDVSRLAASLNDRFPQSDEARKATAAAIDGINREIGKLSQKAQELTIVRNEIVNLKHLFVVPGKAGQAGERVLEKTLSDVLGSGLYETQYVLSAGIVDFVLTFKDCIVPIDSKLSLENFKRMVEAEDDDVKKGHWRMFSADVRKRIDETSKYILPRERTTDFAFMYIASETVYYEAFVKDRQFGEENRLPEYALKKKVCPVSPQTIYPYLVIILQGMKAMKIEENVKEVVSRIAGLTNDFQRFSEVYQIIIRHIDDAYKKHANEGASRLDQVKKNLETLESKTTS